MITLFGSLPRKFNNSLSQSKLEREIIRIFKKVKMQEAVPSGIQLQVSVFFVLMSRVKKIISVPLNLIHSKKVLILRKNVHNREVREYLPFVKT